MTPPPRPDLLIVGAGPAGLATAIEAARRGLSVALIERNRLLPDKACGEGVLPAGVERLEALGIHPASGVPLASARLIHPDAPDEILRFPRPALGIARTQLIEAMYRRALGLGVRIEFGTTARGAPRPQGAGVELETDRGPRTSRLLVLSTGLPTRPALPGPRRFGVRRHYRIAPWSASVEVHFSEGVEAYITPVAPQRINLAFLWSLPGMNWDRLLARFPRLQSRLRGTPCDPHPRGAGPLGHRPGALVRGRIVRIGDAAGAVDPIAGEGVALALQSADALGRCLPEALNDPSALDPYPRRFLSLYTEAEALANALSARGPGPGTRDR